MSHTGKGILYGFECVEIAFLCILCRIIYEKFRWRLAYEFDDKNLEKHSDNIFFHRWGIGEVDSDALYQRAMRDYAYRKKYGDKKLDELRKWKVCFIHQFGQGSTNQNLPVLTPKTKSADSEVDLL